jgi:hypothetical protein
MTEKKREVKTYEIQKFCPSCNDGVMRFTGEGMSNGLGTFYGHKCKLCGHIEKYKKHYPTIEYEYVN